MQCKFKQLSAFALLTQFEHKNKAFKIYFLAVVQKFYSAPKKNSKKFDIEIIYYMHSI